MSAQLACPVCGETAAAEVEDILTDHGLVVSLVRSECPNDCAPSVVEVKVALGICPAYDRRLSREGGRLRCEEHGFVDLG